MGLWRQSPQGVKGAGSLAGFCPEPRKLSSIRKLQVEAVSEHFRSDLSP